MTTRKPVHLTGVFTDRQAAVIRAVADAEGIGVSDLIRRAVFGFVWGTLELTGVDANRPAVLRLHDFPRIASALRAAQERDDERMRA